MSTIFCFSFLPLSITFGPATLPTAVKLRTVVVKTTGKDVPSKESRKKKEGRRKMKIDRGSVFACNFNRKNRGK